MMKNRPASAKTRRKAVVSCWSSIIAALREVSTPSTIPAGFGTTDEEDTLFPKLSDAMRQDGGWRVMCTFCQLLKLRMLTQSP